MEPQFRCLLFFCLLTLVTVQAQSKSSTSIQVDCLGNVMRVSVGPLGAKTLDVAVGYNNSVISLNQWLASQCGFGLRKHPLGGRTELFVSLQNCFAHNVDDAAFITPLILRVHGGVEDEVYHVVDTCLYTPWASREIICDPDYMEVSVKRAIRDDSLPIPFSALPEQKGQGPSNLADPRRATKSMDLPIDAFQVQTVVFSSPDERPMTVAQALGRGYGITSSPTRLVLRGSLTAPEAYSQLVAGVPMTILKTATIFEKKWIASQIDTAVACPTGGVSITDNIISWVLPKRIEPLLSTNQFKLLEVHMGIDGQRLGAEEMAARKYTLNINDVYIIATIPVGAIGGYLKSTIEDNEYYTSYSIAPMLELLWDEEEHGAQTRYKVLFSITTPLVPMHPQLVDHTIREEKLFRLALGPFASDMVLEKISFSSVALSVTECNARGFNVQEFGFHSSTKTFTLQVPFMDPLVTKTKEVGKTVYSIHLVFSLQTLPASSPLTYTAYLEATRVDSVSPVMSGSCDHQNFHVTVMYGTPDVNFQIILGKHMLTQTLAQHYGLTENGTHIGFVVPFSDPNAVFEMVEDSNIRTRLDLHLRYPQSSQTIQVFSISCTFSSPLTECYPNGTMTVLAVKFESAGQLNPSQLTLNDPTCGPVSNDDRFAFFVFSVNSCGTTRKFLANTLLYENEISLPESMTGIDDPDYQLKVKCYYDFNTTHSLGFITAQANNEPYAEPAKGDLQVVMRTASDASYTMFHRPADYPIPKYLQEPIYFEVELVSANPQVSVELDNCWATLTNDRLSQPRWNLIANGCPNHVDPNMVLFHPVYTDSRVLFPSHYKHFEVQTFAFAMDQDNLSDQLFVHCDVVLCDANNMMGGPCSGQCLSQRNEIKDPNVQNSNHGSNGISSGPISIIKQ